MTERQWGAFATSGQPWRGRRLHQWRTPQWRFAHLLLALTGFTPLLGLDVIDADAVSAAIDYYLDRLFDSTSQRPSR
ncbi:hypothetical protein F5X71_11800 [Nocardia brasiliensis]|uniref:Uncharacterized protein n=1 Tax=Nocardia brasiliensis TaxID=37326 RepID=A0A6G9XPZ3_NOCBR|nr:hypothetical protein [Nocardia brasiliensis]QIS02903.1 hypothetical protein F5X71_11800 [Nocardia brasiliensis]